MTCLMRKRKVGRRGRKGEDTLIALLIAMNRFLLIGLFLHCRLCDAMLPAFQAAPHSSLESGKGECVAG